MALTDKLTAIADAVRAKTGGAELLTLDEIAAAIASIDAGGGGGGASGIVLVDETVTMANNGSTVATTIYKSDSLKNLSWYFALLVKLNPILDSGAYEVVQFSRNSDFPAQAVRWTGSGYSANHTGNYLDITESGEVRVLTSNVSTLPLLAGDYRLIVIV